MSRKVSTKYAVICTNSSGFCMETQRVVCEVDTYSDIIYVDFIIQRATDCILCTDSLSIFVYPFHLPIGLELSFIGR